MLIADIYVHSQQIEAAPKAVFRRGRRCMEAAICLSAAAWAQLVNLGVEIWGLSPQAHRFNGCEYASLLWSSRLLRRRPFIFLPEVGSERRRGAFPTTSSQTEFSLAFSTACCASVYAMRRVSTVGGAGGGGGGAIVQDLFLPSQYQRCSQRSCRVSIPSFAVPTSQSAIL